MDQNKFLKFTLNLVILFFGSTLNAQNFTEILYSQGDTVETTSIDGLGSGVSFYDFNQDGWDDVSFAIEDGAQVILENVQGVLQDASFSIMNTGQSKMILWVDYDNDGYLDLFITTKQGSVKLWKNNGSFSFTDVTISAGLSTAISRNFGASFGDYDRDGDLDLYICKYQGFGDSTDLVDVNNLYRNNGDGTFTDVTWSAGVSDGIATSFLSVWIDYNGDLWPDLFVMNDREGFYCGLYENNQDGTFTDKAIFAGVSMESDNPMSASFNDFDNDQDLDFFVANTAYNTVSNDYPRFFVNQGDGTFSDEATTFALELDYTTWGGLWIDYDNDLDQDLYVATDFLDNTLIPKRNYFMRNEYPNSFVDDTTIVLYKDKANSHAVARGDINRDGFYDIAVHTDLPSKSMLLKNSGNSNNYIRISLEGTVSNKFAIGTWIRVFVDTTQYSEYTYCGENYVGQNSQHHIFGLKDATQVDSIHIEYLSGIVDKYYNLAVNQEYLFIEGETSNTFNINIQGNVPLCLGDTIVLEAPSFFESYVWNTGDTSQSISVSSAGIYQVQMNDFSGNTYHSDSLNIEYVTAPSVIVETNDISCADLDDGQIILNVNSDGRPYIVNWNSGNSGDSVSNLGPGVYVYELTDSFSCTYTDTIELNAPSPINVQFNITHASLDSLGDLFLLINGGTPPFSLYLDSMLTGALTNNLDSGTYYLEVIDANDCYHSISIEVLWIEDIDTISNIINQDAPSNYGAVPNPFTDFVILRKKDNHMEDLNCILTDLTGRTIWTKYLSVNSSNREFELRIPENVNSGLYLLIIQTERSQQTFRMLKH